MSRCFPYPPPGYCRNGAAHEALIESIKLQKETDKAKAERKKEKKLLKKEKKEKKKLEKEKRKNEEKLKSQNNQSEDAHKLSQKEAGIPEAQNNGKKPITEVLEKSDLTEENGQPIKPCYSSDSTQNSNKRRRDDNDNDNENDNDHHGKHIKIRLLKKHKESDPTTSGLPPPRRENNAAQRVPLTQTKSNGLYLGRQQLQQQQRPGPTQLKHDIPSSSASRNIGVQGPNSAKPGPITTGKRPSNETTVSLLNKPSPITNGKRPINEIPVPGNISLLNKPNPIAAGKRPVNENPVSGNISLLNKPSPITTGKRPFSETQFPGTSRLTNGPTNGPTNLGKRKEEPEKAGPSRSRAEKKMMKKHKKYEKLIKSWVPPPVFQALLPQVGDDEDWLSRRTKPVSSTISKGEVETCGVSETGLWQPRARFLAEAGIHALPYTVPY